MNDKVINKITTFIEDRPEKGSMLLTKDNDLEMDELEQYLVSNYPNYKFNLTEQEEELSTFIFIKYEKV